MSDRTRIPRLVLRIASLCALAFSSAGAAELFFSTGTFCPPGGGCEQVQMWAAMELGFGGLLPFVGLLAFTTLFAGSLVAERGAARVFASLAIVGALLAAGLIALQAYVIDAWCTLCVGVDVSAIVAGCAGLAILLARKSESGESALLSPWWAAWIVVVGVPIAYAAMAPDPPIPEVVRARYRRGAINVVEMADFECPYCRRMHPVLRSVLARERNVNLVRVVVPLPFHKNARDAARAYFCAERVHRSEDMADRLFRADDLSRDGTIELARSLGLDPDVFARCLDDPAIESRIRADEQLATDALNQGLPTVYIGARTFLGFDPEDHPEEFVDAVRAARRGEGPRTRALPMAIVAAWAIVAAILTRRRKKRVESPTRDVG